MAQTMGMKTVIPPILVYDNGDFIFFSTVEQAASFLEPNSIDIDNIIVYDSNKNLLHFMPENKIWPKKVIFAGIANRIDENRLDLRNLLAKFFAKQKHDSEILNYDWNKLIELARDAIYRK